MADRPIIFSAPMVRALLAGRKTQTRRLVLKGIDPNEIEPPYFVPEWNLWVWWNGEQAFKVTPFQTGDRLYVRESIHFWSAGHDGEITFAADGAVRHTGPNSGEIPDDALAGYFRMVDQSAQKRGRISRPSIHMPRWASRLTLIVEEARVERLQEISNADARAEGVDRWKSACGTRWYRNYADPEDGFEEDYSSSARLSFSTLWESLHGSKSWAVNPFVVALTFRVIRGNIDQVAA